MSNAGSSRPVPRPLQLSSNSSSPRSSPVMAKSPLSASVRYNNTIRHEERDTPVNSPRTGSKRQGSSLSNTSPSSTQSPQQHVRRNTVASGLSSLKSPTTQIQNNSSRSRSSLQSVKETEPATLAEKHADLLRFIAQKESKCLELRTQLTQHEAELLLLKQKWERIVSKGSPALPGAEPVPPRSTSDVLGGIRDGVQSGFEKVMAVLEPAIASSSDSSSSTSSSGSPVSTTTSMALPSKASSTSVSKHTKKAGSLSLSSSTHGRSSMSSSVSSLFDDTRSNGAQSLDSPIVEDGGQWAQKSRSSTTTSLPSTATVASPSNAKPIMPKNMSPSLSSTLSQLSQLSSSLSSSDNIGKSVASWVSPSLNKKWEELRSNEAISKQSKRASLLFNDMLSALSTSSSSSTTPASASPPTRIPSNCRSPISPLVLDPVVGLFIGTGLSSAEAGASLLDDGPENELGVVLQPDHVLVPTKTDHNINIKSGSDNTTIEKLPQEEEDPDDDERWNW